MKVGNLDIFIPKTRGDGWEETEREEDDNNNNNNNNNKNDNDNRSWMESYTPAKPGPEPTNRQRPPARRVAPQAPPTEHQIRGEGPARREDGEEQQRRDAEVVEQLERDDLREDAQGREGRLGVRRWSGPPAWHFWGRKREGEREGGV